METIFKLLSLLGTSFVTLLKIFFRSSFLLKKYKSTSPEELYIIGNGPSIKKDYENYHTKLSTKNLLSVNGFPLTSAFTELKPSYFLVCSPGFYNDKATDYNVSVRADIISKLIEKTNWPLTFFLPISAKKNKSFVNKIKANNHISIRYFNTTPIEGLYFFSKLFLSASLGSPRPHNVLIPSILQAINSGYKKVYILGADHSWLPQISVNSKNEVLLNQKHFYDADTATPKQMHKNEGHGNRHLHEVLEKFYYSFKSYHLLNRYAKDKACRIVNLTENSYIDAFERAEVAAHFS